MGGSWAANTGDPLVSVIMPAFNGEAFIAEAIDSALAQDYPHLEVIVIDDGSTDGTCDIVRSYGDRVRLLEQKNQGAAAARNLGIEQARGHYIAFLDADDYWWKGKLSLQIEGMRQSGLKMAYSQFIVWHPDGQGHFPIASAQFDMPQPHPDQSSARILTGWTYAELLLDCIVWTSTVIVEKAEVLKAGMFDVSLKKGQDYDLWLKLSRQLQMLGTPQATALYRTNGASITYRISDECYEYRVLSGALNRWGEIAPDQSRPAPGLVQARLRTMLFNHGLAHHQRGKPEVAVASLARAIREHGLRFKPGVYLVLAWLRKLRLQRAA